MSTIAVHGVDVEVRAIGLRRETVVINIDPGAFNVDTGCVHGVHKVGVFGDDAAVVGQSCSHDVRVADVLGAHNKVVPARRVLEMDAGNVQVGGVLGVEKDGPVVLVVGVKDAVRNYEFSTCCWIRS